MAHDDAQETDYEVIGGTHADDLPTDELAERIRSEYQDARRAAIALQGQWSIEDLVIRLVTQHRCEVASAPYKTLMLETGRLVLELGAVRKELSDAKALLDRYRVEEKVRRVGRLSN